MATTFSDEIAFAVVEQQGGVVGHKKRREVVLRKVEDAVVIKYSADSVICLLDPTQRVDNQLLLPARISGRFRVLGAGALPFLDSHLHFVMGKKGGILYASEHPTEFAQPMDFE